MGVHHSSKQHSKDTHQEIEVDKKILYLGNVLFINRTFYIKMIFFVLFKFEYWDQMSVLSQGEVKRLYR